MKGSWEIPVYWYVASMDQRPNGYIATFRMHWSKPTIIPWLKTWAGMPTTATFERLLWWYRWEITNHLFSDHAPT